MTTSKNPPRFIAGRLVMLSRKNTRSGNIDYYYPLDQANLNVREKTNENNSFEAWAGQLGRGMTIFLLETPVMIDRDLRRAQFGRCLVETSEFSRTSKQRFWKIRFLFNEKIYHMYLTKKQYAQELVRFVPARLKKDYSSETSNRNKENNC